MSQDDLVKGVRGPHVSDTYVCCPTQAMLHKGLRLQTPITCINQVDSGTRGTPIRGVWDGRTKCDVDTQSASKKRYADGAKAARRRRSYGMELLWSRTMLSAHCRACVSGRPRRTAAAAGGETGEFGGNVLRPGWGIPFALGIAYLSMMLAMMRPVLI